MQTPVLIFVVLREHQNNVKRQKTTVHKQSPKPRFKTLFLYMSLRKFSNYPRYHSLEHSNKRIQCFHQPDFSSLARQTRKVSRSFSPCFSNISYLLENQGKHVSTRHGLDTTKVQQLLFSDLKCIKIFQSVTDTKNRHLMYALEDLDIAYFICSKSSPFISCRSNRAFK